MRRARAIRYLAVVLAIASLGLLLAGWWRSQPAEVDASAGETTLPTVVRPTASLPAAEPPKVAIAPAPPVSVAIPELNFNLEVVGETLEGMAVAYNRNHPEKTVAQAIYATDFSKAAWASNYGSMPGMSSTNTTYLTCHSSASRDLPCNALARKGAVKPGYHLVMTTMNGEVIHEITELKLVRSADFASSEEARRIRPGGVLLTVCMLQDGRRTQYTWLIIGQATEEKE